MPFVLVKKEMHNLNDFGIIIAINPALVYNYNRLKKGSTAMKKIISIALSLLLMAAVISSIPVSADIAKELGEEMVVWTEENEFVYSGEPQTRLLQVIDDDTPLVEGVDYTVSYFSYTGEEFEQIEIMPYEIGEYGIAVKGIGNYQGEWDNEYAIVADTAGWGTQKEFSGVLNYVDASGTTSAEVMGGAPVWLKDESDGSSAWYGIDEPSASQFRNGSRFWVRWLSQDSDEFQSIYNQLDDEHRQNIEDNKLWIFLTGVTDPDGGEYTNLNDQVSFYIQLGDDWDKDNIGAAFISAQEDEDVTAGYFDNYTCPEGEKTFAKLQLNHFSAYAIYVKSDSADSANSADTAGTATADNAVKTSPATGNGITPALFMPILAAGLGIFALSKRKTEE